MRLLSLLILFILSLQIATGQQLHFTNITTRDGLPSSECYGFLHDSKGFLWIRTLNGLSKFNGTKFKTFTTNNSLKSNEIYSLYEDKNNKIWFATASSHVGYIFNDSVHYIPCSNALALVNGYGQKVLHQIVGDKNNNLYISSHERAYYIEANNNYSTFKTIAQNDHYLKISDINQSLFCIPDTTTKLNINLYQKFTFNILGKTIPVKWEKEDLRQGMIRNPYPCRDKSGNVFFIINNKIYSLKKTGEFISYEFDNLIYHIFIDKENNLWAGCNNEGLWLFKNADIKSLPVQILKNISISGIAQDFEGGIWVSSLSKGLFYCKNLYTHQWMEKTGLDEKPQMLKTINEKIYFADFKNYINTIDPQNSTFKKYPLQFEKSKIGVLDIDPINDNYILSGRNSLFKIDSHFRLLERIYKEKNNKINSGAYNTIITTQKEIAGVSKNAYTNFSNGITMRLPSYGNDIIEFNKKILVAGKNGLYQISEKTTKKVETIVDNKNFIKLILDKHSVFAICKDGSIYKLNQNLSPKLLIQLSKNVNDACLKEPHEIAVAGFDGISIINTINGKIKKIDLDDGLLDKEIFKLTCYKNTIFYGTSMGLGSIEIDKVPSIKPAPKMVAGELKINQKKVYTLPKTIPYNSNITFQFHSVSYNSPSIITCFYHLKGQNKSKINTETGELIFNNLSNGEYHLEVYAVNNRGSKSKTTNYHFTVETPFYKTAWFNGIIIALVLITIALITRLIFLTIKKREEKKTLANKLLAEYQLMGLKAQMNPHFIFNCLNSIQKYILENDSRKAYTYMAKFSKLIRFVLDISDKTFITLGEELQLVKVYVELEQMRFNNKFEFILQGEETEGITDLLVPSLIIQPYLENAIWHGIMNLPEGTNGVININIKTSENNLEIIIQDNGAGRTASAKINQKNYASKANSINQKRIEAINHLLQNQNAIITITDLYHKNGDAAGTQVKIILPKQYEQET